MSQLLTWILHTHSPGIIAMFYSTGLSIQKHGEWMGREQSRTGILIWRIAIELWECPQPGNREWPVLVEGLWYPQPVLRVGGKLDRAALIYFNAAGA